MSRQTSDTAIYARMYSRLENTITILSSHGGLEGIAAPYVQKERAKSGDRQVLTDLLHTAALRIYCAERGYDVLTVGAFVHLHLNWLRTGNGLDETGFELNAFKKAYEGSSHYRDEQMDAVYKLYTEPQFYQRVASQYEHDILPAMQGFAEYLQSRKHVKMISSSARP